MPKQRKKAKVEVGLSHTNERVYRVVCDQHELVQAYALKQNADDALLIHNFFCHSWSFVPSEWVRHNYHKLGWLRRPYIIKGRYVG